MPLVPFAKAEDLRTLVPSMSAETAALALDLVSGSIRSSIGWDVDRRSRTSTKIIRPGGYATSFVLPALNVTAITSVTVDGTVLTTSQYAATESGIVYLQGVVAHKSIVVVYTAGWKRIPDEAPSVFRSLSLEYAARCAENLTGVKSYTIGLVSENFGDVSRAMADDDSRLDDFRVNQ